MQAAADEEANEKGRRTELEVLTEALGAIEGVAAEDVSFLQIAAASKKKVPAVASRQPFASPAAANAELSRQAKAGHVVVGLLGRLAKQQQLPILAQLAGKVSAAFESSGDPLAAARKMVQDLIVKMQEQITSEAQEHGYCKTEIARSEARIKSLQTLLKTGQTEIDQASSSAAVLGAAIDNEREELAALAKEQAGMTGSLDEMKQSMESSKADLQKGLDAVRRVMDKLKVYYGSQQALLQTSIGFSGEASEPPSKPHKEVALMAASMGLDVQSEGEQGDREGEGDVAAEAPPEESLDVRAAAAIAALQRSATHVPRPPAPRQHTASIDAGTSIVHVLEMCESEIAKSLAQLDTQATDEAGQKKELLKQNQILQKQKELDVTRKAREVKAANAEVQRLQADLEAAKSELEPLQEYFAQIKQRCETKVTRQDIMKRRQREIEGLKEALAVLEGESSLVQLGRQRATSFLQRRKA